MAESRQFLGNTVGDYANIVQGNITVTNHVDADAAAPDEAFLRKFSKTNPIDNKNRILESKGRLLDDSYRWILEHKQYTKWRDTENSGVLWIKGDPGKGKTMLLCGIIKEFEKDSKMQKRLAYFFCQGTDNKINTSTAIIRGLIYLFLRQHPKLLSRIQQENEKEPGDFLEGDNEQFALCRIFKSVVKDACISYPVCIIDALDECQQEESLQSLFSLIVDTSSHVKWLLSSRNEKWLDQGLYAVEEHQKLTLELRGNSEHISDAVKTYINHCIQGIHALKDDSELRHKTAELLHAKANGTFLWVTLVVKELRKTSHPRVEAVLQSMPEDLKELYDEIMRRAKKRWRADKHACLTILAIVTAAKRPLLLEELYMFIRPTLSQLEGKYNIYSVKGFVEACGSFISNTNDTIYFIHQSVKDYMVHETNRTIFPSGDGDQHFAMFQISISEMNKTLKRNEYPLGLTGRRRVFEIMPPDFSPSTPIEYCCIFWVEHLVEGCKTQQSRLRECLKNNEEFDIFINKKSLYWLETMIRLKSTSQALEALYKLHALVKTCCAIESETVQGCVPSTATKSNMSRFFSWLSRVTKFASKSDRWKEANRILELTRDFSRVVSQNRDIIEEVPSQIYVSALVFSPMQSRLRQMFEMAESPNWMAVKPVMRQEWNPCLQIFKSCRLPLDYIHCVHVTLSPDNSKLALIMRNSTIEIWNLVTGTFSQKISNGTATNAAFSSNGNALALISDNIGIWDLVSGRLLRKIYHTGVTSVAFINGDAHLSILGPKLFTIHDIARNVDLRACIGQSGERFHDVVFSSSYIQLALSIKGRAKAWPPAKRTMVPRFTNKRFGARLVVTCKRRTSTSLKIVDLATGEYMKTLLTREEDLGKLSFILTSDGMRLVVRYLCATVRVWDLATRLWQIIDFPDKTFTQAVFSPCRRWLAFVEADDKNIDMCDVASGDYRWASIGHADDTTAMAFSPDGSRLALASRIGEVKVLEMTTNKPLKNPKRHSDEIMDMVYSPRAKWLASRSCNGIRLWDPNTGKCKRKWRTPSKLTAFAFSPDSVWLAAGDDKGTMRIYDVAKGKCHHTLASADYRDSYIGIDSVAFSSNGNTLASVERFDNHGGLRGYSYILKTWDPVIGKCLQAVALSGWEGLSNSIARLIFSPDDTQLGSIWRNGTVTVWDASTGKHLQTLVDNDKFIHFRSFLRHRYEKYSIQDKFTESATKLSAYFSRTQGLIHSNKEPELTKSNDDAWILWKKEPKIGIPPEYRPGIFAAHENYCAIATHSHRVLCFRFSN